MEAAILAVSCEATTVIWAGGSLLRKVLGLYPGSGRRSAGSPTHQCENSRHQKGPVVNWRARQSDELSMLEIARGPGVEWVGHHEMREPQRPRGSLGRITYPPPSLVRHARLDRVWQPSPHAIQRFGAGHHRLRGY